MNCRICSQEIREPAPAKHHLERSPIDMDLCLGCFVGSTEFALFLLRATGLSTWSLRIEAIMKKAVDEIRG